MARYCHETSYVVADPFTNMIFFLSDALKGVNPFLDRIPKELHEQYMADFMTELMKMPEINKTTDDGVTSFTCVFIDAFARKS